MVKCCSYQFNRFEDYDVHLSQHHFYKDSLRMGQAPLKCGFLVSLNSRIDCKRVFGSLTSLKRHFRDDHKDQIVHDGSRNSYCLKEIHLQLGVQYGVRPVENVSSF